MATRDSETNSTRVKVEDARHTVARDNLDSESQIGTRAASTWLNAANRIVKDRI